MSVNSVIQTVPKLIASIPYSAFTASQTKTVNYDASLSRRAKSRTFILVNKLNVAPSSAVLGVGYDSEFPMSSYAYSGSTSIGTMNANNGVTTISGSRNALTGSAQSLFGALDSFQLQIPIGATAPTSGEFDIYVTEAFE